MMKRSLRSDWIGLFVLIPLAAWARPHPVALESSIEASRIEVTMDQAGQGTLRVMPCAGCQSQSFAITPQVLVIEQGHRVSHEALRARDGQPATVLFDPKSRRLTRIIW